MTEELRLPTFDFAPPTPWLDTLLELQREQWNALMRWQALLLDMQRDAIDQWVSHWAGGVPIDA